MQKEKVTINELTAGALLKFGKVDSVDMTLLMYGISRIAEVVKNNYEYMDDYFIMTDGSIILNQSYVERVIKTTDNNFLEIMQGHVVKKYLDELDLLEFVLRKIKLLGKACVIDDELEDGFSKEQRSVVSKLYDLGYIENYIQEDVVYGDYQAIRLTQKGKLVLFVRDNKEEVKSFLGLLRVVGYDDEYISKFLLAQDFNRNPAEILCPENFAEFRRKFENETFGKGINSFTKEKIPNKK